MRKPSKSFRGCAVHAGICKPNAAMQCTDMLSLFNKIVLEPFANSISVIVAAPVKFAWHVQYVRKLSKHIKNMLYTVEGEETPPRGSRSGPGTCV